MPKGLSLLFALITGNGWQWARIAEAQQWITAGQALTGSIGLTAIFMVHQVFLIKVKPAKRESARQRAGVVNTLLDAMIGRYYEDTKVFRSNGEPAPAVRANVMLPVVSWFGFRKRLQIFYKAFPEGLQYSKAELDLYWCKNEGVSGYVWKSGHSLVFGLGESNSDAINATIPDANKSVVAGIKSIYCVPIFQDGRPVGVLSLDSTDGLTVSHFENQQVKELVERYAGMLPSQCFESGVKN
jgi:hypothetical protein